PTPPAPAPPTPAPPVATAQPLQVTETPQPSTDFVLTAPTPPQVQAQLPQPRVVERAVAMPEPVPQVQAPALPQLRVREPQAAARPVPESALHAREVAMPEIAEPVVAPDIRAPSVAPRAPQVTLAVPAPGRVQEREVAQPAIAASPAPATGAQPAANEGTAASAAQSQGQAQSPPATVAGGSSGGAVAHAPGAGALPTPGAGLPSARHADDWGASKTATAGNAGAADQGVQGLFNGDGSAKLPDRNDSGAGGTARSGVPGSRQQARIDADRAGHWLDRPAFGYQPSIFDKYWVPDGSLLQQWVDKAIREVEIPVPGTGKRIKCVISVLQAGGACGLYDPNKQDRPASARPPPDIPVKRNPLPTDS
ncbi:MAG: hypothetical protein QM601_14460, partial [Pseudoxanthomonas sp.]